MSDYESVALVKPEVFVYRIPPLTNNRGHKYVCFCTFMLLSELPTGIWTLRIGLGD